MLDPRIYRTGMVGVALAVLVLAFSLQNQPGPSRATLAPDAFNGALSAKEMRLLATDYPNRSPGSDGDKALAALVAKTLRLDQFQVSDTTSSGRTADGVRTLEAVTGTRAGLKSGTILVVAHRDGPGKASLSGTATLLELANVLSGETLHRTVVLASTSGSAGAAGATNLARQLGGPIDAVIALGDLAGTHASQPVLIPWSNGTGVAPPALRNTVAAALSSQAGMQAGSASLGGQFVHLAFPLTLGEQGPFGSSGDPAVLLSVSGVRPPTSGEAVDPTGARVGNLGKAVLQSINALDNGAQVPSASAYLLFSGKMIPAWAIRLLVLALILPVLAVAVDGLARANRRGHDVTAWGFSALSATVPFVLCVLAIVFAKATNLLKAAPPGPTGPGTVPIGGAGTALLIVLGLAIVAILVLLRSWVRGPREDSGGAVVVLIAICAATLVIWVSNPFAAALVVPALHLWMWLLDPELRIRRLIAPVLIVIGLAPAVLVALYYALTLGYSPIGLVWSGVLMIAGGHVGLTEALEWCVVLGCAISVAVAALKAARVSAPEEAPVTVRGPVTYAGPGSLGGTESALRARR
jgi:uncharacterized membrane protein YhaH (DUF805 family)